METNSGKLILKSFDRIYDYTEYASWWKNHGYIPPKLDDLPINGFSVFEDKILTACGFLALTDCSFTIFGLWYSNPNNKKRNSYISLKMIIEAAKLTCVYNGRSQVFCYTSKRSMIKLLEGCHFINNDGHLRWCNSG